MQVDGTMLVVVGGAVVFGEVIGSIIFSSAPMNDKLFLVYSVTDPIEMHVDGFGSTLFNSVIGNSSGSTVVGLDDSRGLWVAHFEESGAKCCCLFAVVEQRAEFSFGGTGQHFLHDVA